MEPDPVLVKILIHVPSKPNQNNYEEQGHYIGITSHSGENRLLLSQYDTEDGPYNPPGSPSRDDNTSGQPLDWGIMTCGGCRGG